jgi:hypothetical protein
MRRRGLRGVAVARGAVVVTQYLRFEADDAGRRSAA